VLLVVMCQEGRSTTGTVCWADGEAIGGSGPGAGLARVVTNGHELRRHGWAMRGDRPDPQVGENLLDHRGLLDEGFVASVSTELDEVSAERR